MGADYTVMRKSEDTYCMRYFALSPLLVHILVGHHKYRVTDENRRLKPMKSI